MAHLDDDSQQFADLLFARFPEWRQFGEVFVEGKREEGYLAVNVPAPSASTPPAPEDYLYIITPYGGVTVGFGGSHVDFDTSNGLTEEEMLTKPFEFIDDILEERLVMGHARQGSEWRGSVQGKPSEEPNVSHLSRWNIAFDTIRLRSWKGTYDRIIKVNQNA